MSDADAVAELAGHRYFQPHVTPIQLFNRATDPFLPGVRPHTLAVLQDLDARRLTNHVLVITRHQMKPADIHAFNVLRSLKVTLLFTYSGIEDKRIEPYPSEAAAESLRLMSSSASRRYRTVMYWRPLVPGLNDSDEHLDRAYELSRVADATVFTGLFYRFQIADYYKANGLPEPYDETARRKIVPETLEQRVLAAFTDSTTLFRKTSCALSYAHGLPDYNGHYGIRELCDICPPAQLQAAALCTSHRPPSKFGKRQAGCPRRPASKSSTYPRGGQAAFEVPRHREPVHGLEELRRDGRSEGERGHRDVEGHGDQRADAVAHLVDDQVGGEPACRLERLVRAEVQSDSREELARARGGGVVGGVGAAAPYDLGDQHVGHRAGWQQVEVLGLDDRGHSQAGGETDPVAVRLERAGRGSIGRLIAAAAAAAGRRRPSRSPGSLPPPIRSRCCAWRRAAHAWSTNAPATLSA